MGSDVHAYVFAAAAGVALAAGSLVSNAPNARSLGGIFPRSSAAGGAACSAQPLHNYCSWLTCGAVVLCMILPVQSTVVEQAVPCRAVCPTAVPGCRLLLPGSSHHTAAVTEPLADCTCSFILSRSRHPKSRDARLVSFNDAGKAKRVINGVIRLFEAKTSVQHREVSIQHRSFCH